MITALSGKDTVKINGRILNDFADGDVATLEFPDDLMNMKTGKGGNTLIAMNNSGRQAEVSLRVILGGADDQFLNGLLALMNNNPAGFSLLQGEFDKNVGDGNGNLTTITYVMSGGVFKKNVAVKENADGETEQSLAMYSLKFSNAPRSIG